MNESAAHTVRPDRRPRLAFLALPLAGVFFLLLSTVSVASADVLEDIRKHGKFLWGADQEGGGPYVFPKEDHPEEVTGFEVELAGLIAKYLKVEAEFAQGPWDKMPDLVKTRKVDFVMNGYEWNPVRAEQMASTIPYYVYRLQLMARKDDAAITSWEQLAKPVEGRKRKVGVLTGSAAETYLQDKYAEELEVVSYDGNTDAMREVENKKLDATLQDSPIVAFYEPRFPGLHRVDKPVAPGYYVIFAKQGEATLVAALNEALIVLLRNGDLERLYKKYGIWDDAQESLATIVDSGKFYGYQGAVGVAIKQEEAATPTAEEVVQTKEKKHGWAVVRDNLWILIQAAWVTIYLSTLSFPLAILAGLLIAIGRLYGPTWLRPFLVAYVEFLRGTPVMLQLYFVFFFLPEIGINISAFWTAIIGLAVNYSAYESEIYRAGLQAIPVGQMEAALSLGMTPALALRRIIVPQAVRIVIPPVMNDFIALFKDTSVCSVVTLIELTKRFSVQSQSTQATIELMGITAVLYLLMSYPLSVFSARLEKRMARENVA